jgi:sugar phosphate isomerase/epimerase
VRVLGRQIKHVHFKDVPAVGSHDCVAIGSGIVDVKGVLRELKTCDYDGWLSIEIETADHDPTDEIIQSAETLRALL